MRFIKLFFLLGLECFYVKTDCKEWKRVIDSKSILEWVSSPFEESIKVALYEARLMSIDAFTISHLVMLQRVRYPIERMVSDFCIHNSEKDILSLWEYLDKATIARIVMNYPDAQYWIGKRISLDFWRWVVNDHLSRVDYFRLLKTIQWLLPEDRNVAKCIIDKYAQ